MKYNANTLNDVINRDGCIFIGEYPHLTSNTRVYFLCGNDDCYFSHDKSVDKLVVSGGFCEECTKKRSLEKAKATNLKNIGVENPFQSDEIKKKIMETNLEKYGHPYATQNEDVKKKMMETNIQVYGFANPFQNEAIKDKIKETMIERHGVANPQQSAEIQAKTMETNIQRYGHANPMQNIEVRQRGQETNMERYKVKNPFQAEEFKDKSRETCMERFGYEYAIQSPEVQMKFQETCMDRYGFPNHMQNPEIAERCMKASYYRKEYVFPCGKLVSVQGYEPRALDILINEGFTSDDLIVAESEVPEIWYNKDGKSHRYYCDIFIPKENRIIEVKSDWTVTMETGNVDDKAQASIKAGFVYEIWVFDGKGNRKIVKY